MRVRSIQFFNISTQKSTIAPTLLFLIQACEQLSEDRNRLSQLQTFIVTNMKVQEMLRQQNYQLKNEITDLKNAFDLNRDILKILSNYNQAVDPQLHLLMQIITRLTTVNNQAMLSNIELIHQKNVLKKEVVQAIMQNLRLNIEYNELAQNLEREIEVNRLTSQPNESKLLIQQNINALNKELMAANEQRIIKEQEIQYWKQRHQNLVNAQSQLRKSDHMREDNNEIRPIKRRYTSNESFILAYKNKELQKQTRRLKQLIEQLENRLLIFIKVYNLEQSLIVDKEPKERQNLFNTFQSEREQIRLLKYALNNIQVEKKEDEYVLTITQRFGHRDTFNNHNYRGSRSTSWPKNKSKSDNMQTSIEQKQPAKMQERRYFNQ